MVGDGEWHAHKHKTSDKRRSWRKPHLGVDSDGFIVASQLTESSVDDSSVGVTMVRESEASIERFTADGAYDTTSIYEALAAAGAPGQNIVIPPKRTATVTPRAAGSWHQRNEAIKRIAKVGRRLWRKESRAHQQARGENGMFRYKRIIGDRLRTVAAVLVLTTSACVDESLNPAPVPPCYDKPTLATEDLCTLLPEGCATPDGPLPALSEAATVVPGDNMPAGVISQAAHNNLDIAWHDGRLFFAFRTAASHFADPGVYLYVVSTTDQQSWVLETAITLGKDLREPRLLSLGDRLFLYFARLGEIKLTFRPEAMMMSEQVAGCQWTAPEEISPTGDPGFIPWRTRAIDGVGYLTGYVGGEDIYQLPGGGLEVFWLKTSDGRAFEPVVPDQPVVLTGGVSETDWALLDDGSVIAVARNESGDEGGFGSKICRASTEALGNWTCAADPKKYDSPLVFTHDGEPYLIGRRQVANDGLYDLGMNELTPEDQALEYQLQYWQTPKRCALWKIDPATLTVAPVLDLPSNGDTCFASVVPLSDHHYLVYNYTSPLDDPQLSWLDGQMGETYIYRLTLTMP